MAIRGIDANIMVVKSAEYAAEMSKMQRQNDLMAEQAARQTARQAAMDRARALAAAKVDGVRISPDKQDNGGGLYYPQPRKRDKRKGGKPSPPKLQDPGENTIDITV